MQETELECVVYVYLILLYKTAKVRDGLKFLQFLSLFSFFNTRKPDTLVTGVQGGAKKPALLQFFEFFYGRQLSGEDNFLGDNSL
jgi:hypothetical protein